MIVFPFHFDDSYTGLTRKFGVFFDLICLQSRVCRSQWPRGLRLRSTAARLLTLWFRIPPGAWMFVVSFACCQVEVSATS